MTTLLLEHQHPNLYRVKQMMEHDLPLEVHIRFTTLLICNYVLFVLHPKEQKRPLDYRKYIHEIVFEQEESPDAREKNKEMLRKCIYTAKKLVQHNVLHAVESFIGVKKETYYYFTTDTFTEQELGEFQGLISTNLFNLYLTNFKVENYIHYTSPEAEEGVYRYFNEIIKNADEIWLKRSFRLYEFHGKISPIIKERHLQLFNRLYTLVIEKETKITIKIVVKDTPPKIEDEELFNALRDLLSLAKKPEYQHRLNITIMEDLALANSQMGVRSGNLYAYIERWRTLIDEDTVEPFYRICTDKTTFIQAKSLVDTNLSLVKKYYCSRIKPLDFLKLKL